MNIEFPETPYLRNVFVVYAKRFTTEHEYIEGIYTTRKDALNAAENEVMDRGGSYSCAVYECELNSLEIIKTVISKRHE